MNESEQLEIRDLKPDNKHVCDFITKKQGKYVTHRDIQNLKTKACKQSRGGLKDAQLALDELAEALQADSNSCGGVVVDENNTLGLSVW